ncbi:MAG: FtsK/SpoIIIE domain-containing protein, partial [Ilumatobacteraceae bacterium]
MSAAIPAATETAAVQHGLAVAASLGPGARLAVHGARPTAVLRSLIIQLVASCGPADVRLVIVTDRPDRWDWSRGLPHLALPDGSVAVVNEAGLPEVLAELGDHGAHLLVATDLPAQLATRTSPLRRLLADGRAHALLVAVPEDDGVPHLCTSVLTVTHGPFGRWVADTTTTLLPAIVRVCGIGEPAAFACTAGLRGLVDPEDPLSVASGVPREVSLCELLPAIQHTPAGAPSPAGVLTVWHAAGADPSPRTPIGTAADGTVDIDLVRDGPHGLIAGTTGAGKSELLRSLVVGMALHAGPTHLNFVLVDYKGGATFDACEALPHVVGVITDLDDALADRALRSLHAELRRREGILREHGVADLPSLRTIAPAVVMPRLVVVIDEFAALVAEQPDFLHALVGIAQRGRSLGVHLLLATQRPNGVISDDIRANTNLRLALRLQDTADAIDVVGIAAPALLPRGLPGRAVVRLGADDHLTFQTARCTGPLVGSDETELAATVRAICTAAQLAGLAAPAAPWLPPLPTVLERHEVEPGAIGRADDPDHQRVRPLCWEPSDGHLLIAASPGSGATSALCTLADATLASRDPSVATTWVYVLDGRGDARLAALERVTILACGTSWHAALVGKFLIEEIARVPVEVDYGSEYR